MILDTVKLSEMFVSSANLLCDNKRTLNSMNVFPVPDGDTGTNMSSTLLPVCHLAPEAHRLSVSEYLSAASWKIIRASRGNSGVILSSFFKGFASHFAKDDTVSADNIAHALRAGCDEAYASVMNPTEGTMLSVMRACAETAEDYSENGGDNIPELFKQIEKEAYEATKRTPEQLEVLKKAKVLDSGAYGFYLIISAMSDVLGGKPAVLREPVPEQNPESSMRVTAEEHSGYSYCTECTIDKYDYYIGEGKASVLQEALKGIGESAVIVDSHRITKIHIHTNNPGQVLEVALRYGELLEVKVDNLNRQCSNNSEYPVASSPDEKYGFVAVVSGEGLKNRFRDMGVQCIDGGQSMNPSTDELLSAIYRSRGKNVYVLPNNKNILLAAEKASELCENRDVFVIPSRSVAEGISAMLGFDADASPEFNFESMKNMAEKVSTVCLCRAIRDAHVGDIYAHEGQIIAIVNDKLCASADDFVECTSKLSDVFQGCSFVTVYYGENGDSNTAEEIASIASGTEPFAEAYIVDGGQKIYDYIISVEKE